MDGRRTFIVSLALAACVLLPGCGGGSSAPAGSANAPAGDTLAKIKKEGVLRWGADPSGGAPFVFTDPADPDKIIGFEIDIMDKFAKYMGVKHEVVKGQWDTLPANLIAGRSDIVMNGIEINEERAKKVAFSMPYFIYEQQLTVRVEDKDKYKTLDDLKGHKIGTLSGAEANNVLKKAGFTDEQIVPHDDSMTPYRNLELGRVDAVVQENVIAAHYADPAKMPKVYNIPATFAPGKYAVAVRLEDAALLKEVNRILDLMAQNGDLHEVYAKWHIWTKSQSEIGLHEKK